MASGALSERVALVTGGTRGIGRGIAERFAAEGADVVVVARKADELEETAESLREHGGRVRTVEGSVGDPGVCAHAVECCVDELGGLDVLVNNAGMNPVMAPMVELEDRTVDKVLAVNVQAPMMLVRDAWRSAMAERGGVVLNVASVGGLRVAPFVGAYNVSKAALVHLTRQLALELAPGVRVNALAPGLVKTTLSRALLEADEDGIAAAHPMRRLGTPEDVAEAALFLCSDRSSWLTGEVITIDGGMSLAGTPL